MTPQEIHKEVEIFYDQVNEIYIHLELLEDSVGDLLDKIEDDDSGEL